MTDRQRARRSLGLDDHAFVATTVARLDPVKDLMTLLEATRYIGLPLASDKIAALNDALPQLFPEAVTISTVAVQSGPDGP